MSDERASRSRETASHAGGVRVLCLDEQSAVEAIGDAVQNTGVALSVERTTDPEELRRSLDSGTVDCLVVDGVQVGPELAAPVAEASVPAVLYTARDPANVSDVLLDAVDTLVDKGDPAETAGFLVEKLVGLVGDTEEKSEYALAQALARVDDGDACESHQFLVAPDGTLQWASEPFESVFPVASTTAATASEDFYDRLATLLQDRPSAIRTVTRADRDVDAATEATVSMPDDDGRRHFRHSAHQLPDAAGSLRLEVFRDVTPQVRREARLELLDLLVEQAQDGLYTLDENGVIDFCNESFAEMLGYDRTEIIGRHASTTLAEGELEKGQRTLRHLQRTDDESRTVDMTMLDREGRPLEVSIHYTLLPSEDGGYAGLMGVVRDVTERKERLRTLEQYRTLVESAADPMYVLDGDGRIELLNEPMAAFFGREKDVLVGEAIESLLPTETGERALAAVPRDDEQTFESFERWLTDADGTQRLYEVTVGAIEDDGDYVGSVGTLRDITERERRREELDLLRQVFARVLRHNLRSELSIIMGNTEVLMEHVDDAHGDPAETVLERCRCLEATASKARAIEGVLDSETGRTSQRLERVVERATTAVANSHGDLRVATDVPPSLSVRAHPNLVLAVENLLENAVEHGAPLEVGGRDVDVRLTASERADGVTLSVADGGPGIPECERTAVERGTETPLRHGSGLGLWLVRWIVDRSGGELVFEHADGRTTVRLRLDGERVTATE